jgi:toxin ParE1/3/4
MAPVILQPAAQRDLADCADYFAERSLPTAVRFAQAVAETLRQVATMPDLGSPLDLPNPALAELRFWPVRRFKKYLLFYRVEPHEIKVLRVLHAARDFESVLRAE